MLEKINPGKTDQNGQQDQESINGAFFDFKGKEDRHGKYRHGMSRRKRTQIMDRCIEKHPVVFDETEMPHWAHVLQKYKPLKNIGQNNHNKKCKQQDSCLPVIDKQKQQHQTRSKPTVAHKGDAEEEGIEKRMG